ncbi:lytic transglycosylase domain-containing protein [Romboutsia lituseburensis]|uniref:lytic transglycosylase domain-containing protein n=1 Tax=Romboutsia lituseburensis TaxID=1537 RepID=UPI00215A1499|nr:lytic transglycosylase domain-containing protein [Romboutsia lituseburensis]MCR8746681.1 lytic transglycosylase domain-containing protein [Romboutsia lituseburensis]
MIDKLQLLEMTSKLSFGGSNSCSCNNSNSNVFDMIMISLLKAIAETNKGTNISYANTNVQGNNSNNNNSDLTLETPNSIQNANKVQSTNKNLDVNQRIDNAVSISSKKYGVDENLIRAIIKVESNFNPNCVSRAGAKGLMQLMPENCRDLGVKDPLNIEENIDGGTRHIKEYLDKYNWNVEMALMAYNGGPTRMAKRGVKSINDVYKMPKETQNYVPKVMEYYKGI